MLLKLFVFGIVGVVATPAHYLTLILLVEAGDVRPVYATFCGSVVGALANYLLNRRYTFKSSKPHLDAGPKFFTVALGTGLLNTLLVYLGVDLLDIHYLVVQIGATIVVFLANFLLNSIWIFGEENTT
jgi:putative flippase GtrA